MKATITADEFNQAMHVIKIGLHFENPNHRAFFKNAESEKELAFCQWVIEMVADGKIEVEA